MHHRSHRRHSRDHVRQTAGMESGRARTATWAEDQSRRYRRGRDDRAASYETDFVGPIQRRARTGGESAKDRSTNWQTHAIEAATIAGEKSETWLRFLRQIFSAGQGLARGT